MPYTVRMARKLRPASFVVIALLSYVILNEPLGGLRIAGTALVVIGVVLVAQT